MYEEEKEFTFTPIESSLDCFKSHEHQELLVKWNLDPNNFLIQKFRFTGYLNRDLMDDYGQLLKAMFQSDIIRSMLKIYNLPSLPMNLIYDILQTNIKSIEFFDKLEENNIVSSSGSIRGCFEEIYHGVSASDTLRELLLNEDSENAHIFSESDKLELIFQIFRILVIGGSMCQPEIIIAKESETGEVKISGKVFKIKSVDGMDLFENSNEQNVMIVIIDPMKKIITTIKNTYKPFW